MIVSNYKSAIAVLSLLLLAACVPPPASGVVNNPSDQATQISLEETERAQAVPTGEVKTEEMQVTETKQPEAPQPTQQAMMRTRESNSIRMARQPLDKISLWQTEEDEDNGANPAVWDGAHGQDVVKILPTLVNSDNKKVKDITRKIAMSAVFIPEGMDDMAYTRWRADVLAAQNHYVDAGRLLNAVRIGRDDHQDVESRIAFQLANNQTQAACLEAMASRQSQATPFWQGLEVLCAATLGDKDGIAAMQASLPDGDVKAAAEKIGNGSNTAPLRAALVSAAAVKPENKPLADNEELVSRLKRLISEIEDEDENLDATIAANRGQLLLMGMGVLSADKQTEDTDKVAKKALDMAGF